MNKLYTLRTVNVGKLSELNGKVFFVDIDSKNQMRLIDPERKMYIWATTSIIQTEETENGIIYTTKSGSVYDFVEVISILPSIEIPTTVPLFKGMSDEINEAFDDLNDTKEKVLSNIEKRHEELHTTMEEAMSEIEKTTAHIDELSKEIDKNLDEINKTLDSMDEEVNLNDLPKITEEQNVFRQINYGDGYDGIVYFFESEVTYEQFYAFCKSKQLTLDHIDDYAWYQDHPLLTPSLVVSDNRISDRVNPAGKAGDSSKIWTYLWVRAYTD